MSLEVIKMIRPSRVTSLFDSITYLSLALRKYGTDYGWQTEIEMMSSIVKMLSKEWSDTLSSNAISI